MKPQQRWIETPPVRHSDIAAEARTHAPDWILVRHYNMSNTAYATRSNIHTGHLHAYHPPGTYEARVQTEVGMCAVYVRYLGKAA